MSKLADFFATSQAPMTLDTICKETNMTPEEAQPEIDQLLESNELKSREFEGENHQKTSVYWAPHLMPFTEKTPIVTSPYSSPYDHQTVLERLNDQQLVQEKIWLQTRLRKVSTDLSNLQHLSKIKYDEEAEAELDDLITKWLTSTQEMLWSLKSKAKQSNPDVTMTKLIQELRIDPATVMWNEDEEDFDPVE